MNELEWASVALWLTERNDWRWLPGAAITLQALLLFGAAVTRRRGARKQHDRLDSAQTLLSEVKGFLAEDPQFPSPPDIPGKGKVSKELEDAVKSAMAPFVAELTKKLERAEQEVITARREAKAASARADTWAVIGVVLAIVGIILALLSLR